MILFCFQKKFFTIITHPSHPQPASDPMIIYLPFATKYRHKHKKYRTLSASYTIILNLCENGTIMYMKVNKNRHT